MSYRTRTRRKSAALLAAAAAAILLAGCAHRVNQSSAGPTPDETAANRARPYYDGLAALRAFSAEPGCTGQGANSTSAAVGKLKEEAQQFSQLSHLGGEMPQYAETARQQHTEIAFAFADKAKDRRCLDIAEQQYKDLINTYIGGAYGGIRDRAKVGLDDVRDARRSQPVPQK